MIRVEDGGCYCGGIRIQALGEPVYVSYCHCRDCRRSTGAPVAVFVGYSAEQVSIWGTPKVYGSSAGIQRSFCSACGTPISYEDEQLSGEIYFTLGVFDEPTRFEPQSHGWTSQSLDWLRLEDSLPRHEQTSRPR